MAPLELLDFTGDWTDSLGNDVRVTDGAKGVQAKLSNSKSKKEIVLQLKKVGQGSYECGEYDLDQRESSASRICWRHRRDQQRITVWTRLQPHDRGDAQETRRARRELPKPVTPTKPGDSASPSVHREAAAASPFDAARVGTVAAAVSPFEVGGRPLVGQYAQQEEPRGQTSFAAWTQPSLPFGVGAAAAPSHALPHPHAAVVSPPVRPPPSGPAVVVPPPPPAPGAQGIFMPKAMGGSPGQVNPMVSPAASGSSGSWPSSVPYLQGPAPTGGLTRVPRPPGPPMAAEPGAPHAADPARPESEAEKAGWSEVLQLLTAAASGEREKAPLPSPPEAVSRPPVPPPPPPPPPAGQIDELFSPFGLPQPEVQATEEERNEVLEEILARLRAVTGAGASQGAIKSAPWRRASADAAAPAAPASGQQAQVPARDDASASGPAFAKARSLGGAVDGGAVADEQLPDWARKSGAVAGAKAAPMKQQQTEAVLDKFIRVFRLDKLAAECLGKLQDDEVAFVIEACQGRLPNARNPSAVVMTHIKSVAARVGRRYYGARERETSELEALLAAAGMADGTGALRKSGDLQFIEGSPPASPEADDLDGGVAGADPYGGAVEGDDEDEEEEEEEEEKAVDEAIDVDDADEPDSKKRRVDDGGEAPAVAVVEVDLDDDDLGLAAALESDAQAVEQSLGVAECASPEDDEEEGGEDGLFFVDTGGP